MSRDDNELRHSTTAAYKWAQFCQSELLLTVPELWSDGMCFKCNTPIYKHGYKWYEGRKISEFRRVCPGTPNNTLP